jgi:hypothetical protein
MWQYTPGSASPKSVTNSALNRLFQLNRRVFKAYLLKESLETVAALWR